MGNAKFWFHPHPAKSANSGQLISIDMGEALGELSSSIFHDVVDGIGYSGGVRRSVARGGEIVTIQRDRMRLSEDLAHQFDALQNQLDRGFSVSFSADADKCWSGFCARSPEQGDRIISVNSDTFRNMTGNTYTPVGGDYLVLETGSPKYVRETVKVRSSSTTVTTGGSIDINYGGYTDKVVFSYANRPAFLRWYRWWPVLKRAQSEVGKPIITNEGGRLWSLNVTLFVDYATLFANYNGEEFGGDETPLIGDSSTEDNNTEGQRTVDGNGLKTYEDDDGGSMQGFEVDAEFSGDFREMP